jgi:hypothetical protein
MTLQPIQHHVPLLIPAEHWLVVKMDVILINTGMLLATYLAMIFPAQLLQIPACVLDKIAFLMQPKLEFLNVNHTTLVQISHLALPDKFVFLLVPSLNVYLILALTLLVQPVKFANQTSMLKPNALKITQLTLVQTLPAKLLKFVW